MSLSHLHHLNRSYRLFPACVSVIEIRRRSWLSGLLPSVTYMREWSGAIK